LSRVIRFARIVCGTGSEPYTNNDIRHGNTGA
jgi:hypothetical protein